MHFLKWKVKRKTIFAKKACALFACIVILLYGAFPVFAAAPAGIEANPICWSEAECKTMVEETLGLKYIPGDSWKATKECTEGTQTWGRCRALAAPETKIAIGGKLKYEDIGDYLETVYTYLIAIAGIVATILIMAAGFDWILAAGSAEAISHAKTKIVNATMGLILVVGSYLLLSTINPDLVKLKLPQAYLLRRVYLGEMAAGEACFLGGPSKQACEALNKTKAKEGEKYACVPVFKEGPAIAALETFSWVIVTIATGGVTGELEALAGLAQKLGGVALNVGKGAALRLANPWKKVGESFKQLTKIAQYQSKQMESYEYWIETYAGLDKATKGQALKELLKSIFSATKSTAKQVAVAGVGGYAAVVIPPEVVDLLEKDPPEPGAVGFCEARAAFAEGEICNVNASFCNTGLACVEILDMEGWVVGTKMGVCSKGDARSVCNSEKDCKQGLQCLLAGGKVKTCSDGTLGTACEGNPSICQAGLKCEDGRCAAQGPVKLHEKCSANADPGQAGSCAEGKCVAADGKLEGFCTNGKAGSECFEDAHCNDPKYFIKCFGADEEQNKVGICQYLYYNSSVLNEEGKTVLSNENPKKGQTCCENGCPANLQPPPICANANCEVLDTGTGEQKCANTTATE